MQDPEAPTRLGVVDDQRIFLDAMEALLADEPAIDFVFTALSGAACLERLERDPVDVLLMDLSMPGMDGLETSRKVLETHPSVAILMLTTSNNPEDILGMRRIGAMGYLLKNTGRKELLLAIRSVAAGRTYYSDEAARAVIDGLGKPAPSPNGRFEEPVALTDRELDVLKLIASEHTTVEIAERLFLSPHTVETHRKNLLSKVGAKNTAGLVHYAIKQGLVE